MKEILFAGSILLNPQGDLLVVRKKGSPFYMMPGGKIEDKECPNEALKRELYEELNLIVELDDLVFIGTHDTIAVNEAETRIKGYVFSFVLPENRSIEGRAEIEEVRWLTRQNYRPYKLAHLLKEFVLPRWLDM